MTNLAGIGEPNDIMPEKIIPSGPAASGDPISLNKRRVLTLADAMKKLLPLIGLSTLILSSCGEKTASRSGDPVVADETAGFHPALSEVVGNLETNGSHFSVTHIDEDLNQLAKAVDGLLDMARESSGEIPANLNVVSLIGQLGLDKVEATGRSSRWNEGAWHNRYFVQTGGSRSGLLSVMGGAGSEWRAASMAPSDADLVAEIEINLTQLKETFKVISTAFGEEGQQGYEEMIREEIAGGMMTLGDLLGKTDLRATLIISMDEEKRWNVSEQVELPTIHMAMRLERGMWLWDQFGEVIEADAEVSERDGNKIVMAPEEMETPMGNIRPIIMLDQRNDVIWVALTEDYLERCQSGESTLASSEDFKKATAGLPEKGNGLLYVSDGFCNELVRQITQASKNVLEGSEMDLGIKALMSLLNFSDEKVTRGYAWCVANTGSGILAASNAPFADKNYGMMNGIFPVATFTGLTAPMVLRQRHKADQTEAISNMRQLGLALFEYDAEFGKYPENLGDLAKEGIMAAEDVARLNGHNAGGEKVPFTYISGLSTANDPSTIILHSAAPIDGKRAILRNDLSVSNLPEDQFQQLLQQQQSAE